MLVTPITGALGYGLAMFGRFSLQPEVAALVGILIGAALLGPLLGWPLLRLIRIGAGGHRRLTHSALLGGAFGALATILWQMGQPAWALVPGALVWGQFLHVLGDIVTPAGVPLLYPISTRDVGLPRPFSTYGESIATLVAIIAGYVVLYGGW